MNAAATAPQLGLPARRALVRAVLVVWLPALVPIATGTLRGCGHCLQSYLLSLPLVPGVLAPVLLGLDDAVFFVVAGVVTLLVFVVTALAVYELPRPLARVVELVVVLAVAFEAIGYANALRA